MIDSRRSATFYVLRDLQQECPVVIVHRVITTDLFTEGGDLDYLIALGIFFLLHAVGKGNSDSLEFAGLKSKLILSWLNVQMTILF
jgi:hypothetical protein